MKNVIHIKSLLRKYDSVFAVKDERLSHENKTIYGPFPCGVRRGFVGSRKLIPVFFIDGESLDPFKDMPDVGLDRVAQYQPGIDKTLLTYIYHS